MALRCGQLVGRAFKIASGSMKNLSVLSNSSKFPAFAMEAALVRPYHLLRKGQPACALCAAAKTNTTCSCGYHNPGADKEIAEFLVEEIATETKSQKFESLPKLEGFDLKTEEALITLTRKFKDETITVTVDINHSVDSDGSDEELEKQPGQDIDFSRLQSKPSFLIQMSKGGKTMEFVCSMNNDLWINHPNDPAEYNDTFVIDELVIYEGEKKDSTYSVAGAIMDGQLYDLLMNVLDERGVTNQFAEQLVDFCTAYEHKLYIGLLGRIKSFFGGK